LIPLDVVLENGGYNGTAVFPIRASMGTMSDKTCCVTIVVAEQRNQYMVIGVSKGGTMPDLQSVTMADITVAPLAYQGPTLPDIGIKLIAYEEPQRSDITLTPIQFSEKTFIANKPTLKQANAPSAMSTSIALVPKAYPRRPARAEDPVAQARPEVHRQRTARDGNHQLAGDPPGRS
jgi:hypothetical protein